MFNVGDKISHPMHGAGVISQIVTRKTSGEKKDYYELIIGNGAMTVLIPVESAEKIGVRHVVDCDSIEKLFCGLSDIKIEINSNWNKRYRENMLKIKSGDLWEVAGVIKGLVECDRRKSLSTGERKMLRSAKQIVISEIVLVTGITSQQAEARIMDALQCCGSAL